MFLGADTGFGKRESLADFARVLSEYVTSSWSAQPTSNRRRTGQTLQLLGHQRADRFQPPLQALADLYTIRELVGNLRATSCLDRRRQQRRPQLPGLRQMGMKMIMALRPYQFTEKELAWIQRQAPQLDLTVTEDPSRRSATPCNLHRVWASMGQETKRSSAARHLPLPSKCELMSHAKKARFSCTACPPIARGSHRRSDRRPAKRVVQQPQTACTPKSALAGAGAQGDFSGHGR